ncbi:MAG TPA: cytidine deaminase [Acidobacteriaceae bacterium]|jgi:homotetrameric cytidine deaminase
MNAGDQQLFERLTTAAAEAAAHAYAPYSKFRVGAALLLANGAVVTGANVENASYGLTICAEQSAVVRAIAEHGPVIRIVAVAVTNLNDAPSPPCGACRQILSEFVTADAWLAFRGSAGWEKYPFDEVFPFRFVLEEPSLPNCGSGEG